MGELNIETLCANTPQAKGRVERANATLQDRLVKELRLAGISTVEAANAFAEEFIESFNKRFARPARNPHNAHRPLRDDEQLQDVFIWKETRKVSRSLTLHYKRVMYVLDDTEVARSAITKQVELYESDEGEVTIWHGDRQLHARAFSKGGYVRQAAVVENKHLSAALAYAKEMQEQRTAQRLKGPSVTKREKRLMAQQQAAAEGLAPS